MDANQGEARFILDFQALKTNLRTIRRHLAAEVKVCAVLKADAYGHGADLIARAIVAAEAESPFQRVDAFAVTTFEEAAQLDGFGKPIMLLRPVENAFLGRQRELIEHAIRSRWTLTISRASAADDVARIAMHLQARANVQIMIDTGMSRCGVRCDEFPPTLERTLHHPSLTLTALATHFANADVPGDAFTSAQLRNFNRAIDEHPILESVPRHAASSGAVFFTPRAHFDMVRPGIALYGVDPTCRPSTDRPLTPVGRLVAPIIAIHDVQAGESVGYGQTWQSSSSARVAIVSIGYADGYPRLASNKAVTMLHGKVCGVVGRVSMDMCAIDITRCPEAVVGDDVTVIDSNPLSPASIYTLARAADTIPYEILTRIGKRVTRVLAGVEAAEPVDEDVLA